MRWKQIEDEPSLDRVAFHLEHVLTSQNFRWSRRAFMFASLFSALGLTWSSRRAHATPINSAQTQVVLPDEIKWSPWTGLPPYAGEVATLYGGLDQPGPYLALMKWHPGYASAPHLYATDRLSLVLSGTWWVNSGADFDPAHMVPVPAGGFVRRVARTPHYDGVKKAAKEPAIVGIFGMAPVELKLIDPTKPAWRQL